MKEKRGVILLVFVLIFLMEIVSSTTIILNSSYNLGDAYVGSAGDADKNFGSGNLLKTGDVARTYIIFNTSLIPINQKIDDSMLCLYVVNTKKPQLINVSHVYSSWTESLITWNNQPCGINFTDSSACNLTAESNFQMNSSIQNTWLCWNITQMTRKSYSNGNKTISFILSTSDALINSFNSKEQGDFSLGPYLNISYSLADIIAPDLNIVSPTNGASSSTGTIDLNYTASDSGVGLSSCWYRNNTDASNITIACGTNTTISQGIDGDYIVYMWANDTLNNVASTQAIWQVSVNAPSINLIYPADNSWQNNGTIRFFNFTAEDSNGIDTCEFWGNWTGTWHKNQSRTFASDAHVNSSEGYFTLNITDINAIWNVKCNNSATLNQNSFSVLNRTLGIDTINPTGDISAITTSVGSQTVRFLTNFSDLNLDFCRYSIYNLAGGIDGASLDILFSCNNLTSVIVSSFATFNLSVIAIDKAGNNLTFSSFFTITQSSGGDSGNSGSGGGGGGSTMIIRESNNTINLTLNKISGLIGEPGENKKIKLNIKNTGTGFLNNCELKGYGDYSSWISGGGTKNLAAGEEYEFEFEANIPEDISGGNYILGISLNCKEIEKKSSFNIELINKQLDFKLVEVKRITDDNVKLIYSIEELSGIDQNVSIQFLLFGKNKEKITEVQEQVYVSANSKEEFETSLLIDSSLSGDLDLLVNLNSETYSTFVEENVVLGKVRLGGFAIFGDIKNMDNIVVVLLILLFLVFSFFIVRKIFSHKKTIKIKDVIRKIEKSYKNKNY